MNPIRLLVISGSARAGSLNLKLAHLAVQIARTGGAAVTELDLRELALPVYDGDLEAAAGVPPGATRLRAAILACDALLIVTPEYNGFPPPLLINAFDWLSRLPVAAPTVSGLAATANKPVGLMAASAGALGGVRAINFLRQYLQMAFAMLVVPQQFALARANEAFDDAGALKDPKSFQAVGSVVRALAHLAEALGRGSSSG